MLKKAIVSMVVCGCIFALGNGEAFAEIAKDELNLGGVYLMAHKTDITSIYGKPTREENGGFTLYYGDSVTIGFSEGQVTSVTVTANNGWKTSAGLAVGMEADEAIAIYGDPDQSEERGNKKIYLYFIDSFKRGKGHLGIVFDKDSKTITKLNIFRSTMADYKEYYPNWLKRMFN